MEGTQWFSQVTAVLSIFHSFSETLCKAIYLTGRTKTELPFLHQVQSQQKGRGTTELADSALSAYLFFPSVLEQEENEGLHFLSRQSEVRYNIFSESF